MCNMRSRYLNTSEYLSSWLHSGLISNHRTTSFESKATFLHPLSHTRRQTGPPSPLTRSTCQRNPDISRSAVQPWVVSLCSCQSPLRHEELRLLRDATNQAFAEWGEASRLLLQEKTSAMFCFHGTPLPALVHSWPDLGAAGLLHERSWSHACIYRRVTSTGTLITSIWTCERMKTERRHCSAFHELRWVGDAGRAQGVTGTVHWCRLVMWKLEHVLWVDTRR